MACAKDTRNYRGTMVTYAKVIDTINCNSEKCTGGGLSEFIEEASNDLMCAYENTEISDICQYAMSIVWSAFMTFKVKVEAVYSGLAFGNTACREHF